MKGKGEKKEDKESGLCTVGCWMLDVGESGR